MRLPPARFTIRLLIAMAILGIGLYPIIAEERQRRAEKELLSLADYHASMVVSAVACSRTSRCTFIDRSGRVMTSAEVRASAWHQKLAAKYGEAALRPWLPIEPDPPPPEAHWVRYSWTQRSR